MFIHNFKYTLKTLFRNKMLIFWTFAFPIILGTFFNLAFSNIENSEKMSIVNIAIVDNEDFQNNDIFKETFKELSSENSEDQIFNTKYVTEDEAKKLLEDKEISGYLILNDKTPKVVVATNGMDETVLKYVTEEITQNSKIVEDIAKKEIQSQMAAGNYNIDYKQIYKDILEKNLNMKVNIENISNQKLSYTMIEFYTLIAMACLYGGIIGLTAINQSLANMSNNGKRVSVSPLSKGRVILGGVAASYVTQLIGIALLFIYTIFVLHVDYGSNLPLVVLLTLVGCLAGLSLGVAIASLIKSNETVKTGIIISVTMLGCFLSGMMGITMKYVIDKNVPIINQLNPASMITDGFYSLYYYDTLDRFFTDVVGLLIFAVIMIFLSYNSLRRQKYDSI